MIVEIKIIANLSCLNKLLTENIHEAIKPFGQIYELQINEITHSPKELPFHPLLPPEP